MKMVLKWVDSGYPYGYKTINTMNIDFITLSTDSGYPNVDGTSLDVDCPSNSGGGRSTNFDVMAGLLENGQVIDELRETVDISQSAGQQDSIFKFYIRCINDDNVNIPFINDLANISEFRIHTSDTDTIGLSPIKSQDGINYIWTYNLTNIINTLPDNLSTLKILFNISLTGYALAQNGYSQATGHLTGSIVTSTGASQSAENFVILTQTNANSQVRCEYELPWNSSSRSVNANLVYAITVY